MRAFANTDIGLVRQVNEDDYCLFKNNNGDMLAVVCDGIGGSAAGEVASHIAIATLRDAFLIAPEFKKDSQVSRWIQVNLNKANDTIFKESQNIASHHGMGTTVVGAILTNFATYIFNVGDSRIYAGYSDGMIQMSEDHSVIAQLLRERKITEEQAKTHAQKNTLTNALGVWKVFRIDTNKIQSNFKYLLLCSDGLHGYIDDSEIQEVLENPSLKTNEKVNTLISRANYVGGFDNCTIILIEKEESDR